MSDFNQSLQDLRESYDQEPLRCSMLADDPVAEFEKWMQQAIDVGKELKANLSPLPSLVSLRIHSLPAGLAAGRVCWLHRVSLSAHPGHNEVRV